MQAAGLKQSEIDCSIFTDKVMYTFRKTKVLDESCASIRFNPLNLINFHFRRYVNDTYLQVQESNLVKRVHQSRPSVILALDNEYLSMKFFEDLNEYEKGVVSRPKRHFYGRFVKDL